MLGTSTDYKASLISCGFAGDLLVPGDEGYEASLIRFAKNARRRAGLVAFVKSAEDVSLVIKFATSNHISIAVCGGGHNTNGASSSEGGIVIDLSRHCNKVCVEPDQKLGYVGGGTNWEVVDKEAIKYGLAAVGGTVNRTGVGGFTLGGGYGWLMGRHGMAIDNLHQATLVTASGEILTVSNASNPDLFWAIRGAGPNFGVVTEFVYRLHPQNRMVFAGPLIYPPLLLSKAIDAMGKIIEKGMEDVAMILVTTSKISLGGPGVVVIVFFNGNEEEGRKHFRPLFDLGPVEDSTAMIPYEALNAIQNSSIAYGVNYHHSGVIRGIHLPSKIAETIFTHQLKVASKPLLNGVLPVVTMLWEFYPWKKQSSITPDATAFRMRRPHAACPIFIKWDDVDYTDVDKAMVAKEAYDRLAMFKEFAAGALVVTLEGAEKSKDDTKLGNGALGNVKAPDAARILFGDNYERLVEIKKKYDPNMIFNSWYPVQPAA